MSPSARRRAISDALAERPMTTRELGLAIGLYLTTLSETLFEMELEKTVAREESGEWTSATKIGHMKVSKYVWRLVA